MTFIYALPKTGKSAPVVGPVSSLGIDTLPDIAAVLPNVIQKRANKEYMGMCKLLQTWDVVVWQMRPKAVAARASTQGRAW